MWNSAIALINSQHHRDGSTRDFLDDDGWVATFAQKVAGAAKVSRTQLQRLRTLRAALRQTVTELSRVHAVSARTLRSVNSFLQPITVRATLTKGEGGGFILKRSMDGPRDLPGQIAQDFAELVAQGDCRRLKACENETCRWVFYDESRNRVRRWCDSTRCGNVMKVRRFRERGRAQPL